MIRYKGIHHVAVATNDMDKTIRFWRDLLGMRLVGGHGKPGNRQYFFEVSENALISFFEWPEVEPMPDKDPSSPVKGPFSLDHISIEVKDEDELWRLKDRLEAAGVWVTEVIDHGFIHSIFSTDPNNIQIEFCASVGGLSLSTRPRMLDSSPSDVAKEGPEPQPDKWPSVERVTPPEERRVYPGDLKRLIE
jgi:catechol 2,3-dioxygenase-like lactoylglutathione lyase family enzyme